MTTLARLHRLPFSTARRNRTATPRTPLVCTNEPRGISLCRFFQRSPLRRSRIVESTPGLAPTACAAFASSIVSRQLRLLIVPTWWFHATSPVFSSSILSALLQRLTTLGLIVVSPRSVTSLSALHRTADPRDCSLPFEAFPPPIAVVTRARLRRLLTSPAFAAVAHRRRLVFLAGRLSPPARLSPRSAAPPRFQIALVALMCLEACLRRRPACCHAGPLLGYPKRSRAPGVHQPPCRLVVQPISRLRTSRFFSIVGSVARPPFPANRARCSLGLGLQIGRAHV